MNLSEAEAHTKLGLPVPNNAPQRSLKRAIAKLSWFFLHHQVAFNTEVLSTLNNEVLGAAGLNARVEEQGNRINGQSTQLDALGRDIWSAIAAQSAQFDALGRDVWSAIAAQGERLDALGRDLWSAIAAQTEAQAEAQAAQAEAQAGQLEAVRKDLWAANGDLWTALSAQTSQLDDTSHDLWEAVSKQTEQIDTLAGDLWAAINEMWAGVTDAREALDKGQDAVQIHVDLMQRQAFARHHEGIGVLRSELVDMSLQFAEIQTRIEESATEMRRQVELLHKEIEVAAAETRRRQGVVDVLLNEVRRSLPEPPAAESLEKLPSTMENLYSQFQEVFRGSSLSVSAAVREYLPDVLALDGDGPVLDLGSGRGEWLEILKEAGVDAYGVDASEDFVEQCTSRGLKVVLADAREHLAELPERSLSAVTAFHFVEHVSVDRLIEVIDLSVRALRHGGLLILETPNPENLTVGASSFYLDPSHVRPLPPDLLAFLLEARGLAQVETRFLHPRLSDNLPSPRASEPWSDDMRPLVETINARLYGPQDYAVIGRRL